MKLARFPFSFLLLVVLPLAACDSVADLSDNEGASAYETGLRGGEEADPREPSTRAKVCPCFNRQSLADVPAVFATTTDRSAPSPYLFFDVFNYYGLDNRRTEVRSTWRTTEGTFEEVAAVYITPGEDELHLICFRQEVVRQPGDLDLTYAYETLAPTVEEAEACRQDLEAFVSKREPCQGAACDIPYSKEQLDPTYPPYNDEGFRTPDSVLDQMRLEVERVSRMLRLPA